MVYALFMFLEFTLKGKRLISPRTTRNCAKPLHIQVIFLFMFQPLFGVRESFSAITTWIWNLLVDNANVNRKIRSILCSSRCNLRTGIYMVARRISRIPNKTHRFRRMNTRTRCAMQCVLRAHCTQCSLYPIQCMLSASLS